MNYVKLVSPISSFVGRAFQERLRLNDLVQDTKVASSSRELISRLVSDISLLKVMIVEMVAATLPTISILRQARLHYEHPKQQRLYKQTLANFSTETVFCVLAHEVIHNVRSKLILQRA